MFTPNLGITRVPCIPIPGSPRSSRDKRGIYLPILPVLPQRERRDPGLQFKCGVQVRLFDLRMYILRSTPVLVCRVLRMQGSHKDVGLCALCINARCLGTIVHNESVKQTRGCAVCKWCCVACRLSHAGFYSFGFGRSSWVDTELVLCLTHYAAPHAGIDLLTFLCPG